MNTLKDQIEAAAKAALDKAQEVIRAAQELHHEGRIPESVLTEAVKLCESGLPYAAEQNLQKVLMRQMLEDLYFDMPEPSQPFIY